MKPIVEISCKLLEWPLCTEFGSEQPIAAIITLLRKYFEVPDTNSVTLMYGKRMLKPDNVKKRWKDYKIKENGKLELIIL